MKENKKYVVINLTNGEGYNEPSIQIFNSYKDAEAMFHQEIGEWTMYSAALEVETKRWGTEGGACLLTDGEDNFGVHLLKVETKSCIYINTNFSDEIEVSPDTTIEKEIDNRDLNGKVRKVKNNSKLKSVIVEDEEDGTLHAFTFIK